MGFVLFGYAILTFIGNLINPLGWLRAIYYIIFAGMILGAEFKKDKVLNSFGFLHHGIGKGLFDVFLATMCVTYGEVIEYIFAGVFFIVGVLIIVLAFCKDPNAADAVPPP